MVIVFKEINIKEGSAINDVIFRFLWTIQTFREISKW